LDLHYKIQPDSDHVAKCHGDRSRELGERWAKKRRKKTSLVKHKTSRNTVTGGLTNAQTPQNLKKLVTATLQEHGINSSVDYPCVVCLFECVREVLCKKLTQYIRTRMKIFIHHTIVKQTKNRACINNTKMIKVT